MSDEENLLRRLASRFPMPADPLAGVADHRHRRARRRRIASGVLGVALTGALIVGLSPRFTRGPAAPGRSGIAFPRTVEANGMRIDIPSNYSVLTSAEAFSVYQVENGGWSAFGFPECGWARRGPDP